MKIKNEYIIIKNGKKNIKLHNMILNKYLDLITENQLDNTTGRNDLEMVCCYLKFDDQIVVNENSNIYSNSFDIVFQYEDMKIEESQKSISVIYNYNTIPKRLKIFDLNEENYITDLNSYIGKKITAIGFGPYYDGENVELYACVDTNNYNLYLNDILFSIIRKDMFSTDGFYHCPSKLVNSPVHLFNKNLTQTDNDSYYFGNPKSIGLGLIPTSISEEHTLLPYSNHIISGERLLSILDELHVSYDDNGLYPSDELYPSINLWPARKISEPIYPSLNIYPGQDIYPLETPYMWYIIKYEIYKCKRINNNPTIEDTGEYYLISLPINGLENIKSNIKYERA